MPATKHNSSTAPHERDMEAMEPTLGGEALPSKKSKSMWISVAAERAKSGRSKSNFSYIFIGFGLLICLVWSAILFWFWSGPIAADFLTTRAEGFAFYIIPRHGFRGAFPAEMHWTVQNCSGAATAIMQICSRFRDPGRHPPPLTLFAGAKIGEQLNKIGFP